MARPLRVEYESAFYHVIQRGIERKDIFDSDKDKERFLHYLNRTHITYRAIIHAYCLMNNHYHLILETPKANLSKTMHYLNTSYAAYYNANQRRVGPLYQGRFKAILVQADEYLHYLSSYIHLNPVKINLVKDPADYPFSSYKYYTTKQKVPAWLNIDFILSMFGRNKNEARSLYKEFVLDNIDNTKEIIEKNTKKGFILGNENFLQSIMNKFINSKTDMEIPALRELKNLKEPTLERIREAVSKKIPHNAKLQRKLGIYLSRKYTQKTLNNIAAFYGKIQYTGISQAFRRTEQERIGNGKINSLLKDLEKAINV